jgi:hypothetical protein
MTTPADRRLEPRQPSGGRGVIVAPGLELACIVSDVSASGMRVRLERQLALPARVTLVTVADGLAHECDVAWKKGNEAGLKRLSQSSLRGLAPSRLLHAREAWLRAGGR